MAIRFNRSSGNVFRDLGFPEEEARNLEIRSDLMIQLTKLIQARSLTRSSAARFLRVPKSVIADLLDGEIDRFTIDDLVGMLWRGGARVAFSVDLRKKVA